MSTIKLNGTSSGSSIIKAPDSGSTNQTFTLPASTDTLAVNSDVTNKLPLAGGTMTGDTLHADAVYSRWGAGNDLRIGHENNNSYIQDVGSGDFIITTDGANISLQKGTSEYLARFFPDGSNEFYHNNVKKLETTSAGLEVQGKIEINSGFEFTAENGSTRMSIAHNTGNVWIDGNCSAASFTDRTPYPETLQLAYDVINSHKKLPDGQYKADDHSKQLDHSQLHEYVKADDNNRNMSGVISCLVEVIKDLSAKVKALEEA